MALFQALIILKSDLGGEGAPDSVPPFLPYLFSSMEDPHMQHIKN